MDGDAAWAEDTWRGGMTAALSDGDLELTARLSRQGLDKAPGDPDLLRLLLITQVSLGHLDEAQRTADLLYGSTLTEATLDAILSARLASSHVAAARDIVAAASRTPTVARWAVEAARARIAMHQGDLAAARAILVRGIERDPEARTLRTLMLEVLMADGAAAHAREIIRRLGQPPTAPGPEAARSDQGVADRRGG